LEDPRRTHDVRVVITGMGVVSPLGHSVEAFWEAIQAGRSGTSLVTAFDTSEFPHKLAGEVRGFDPLQWMTVKKVRRTGRATQFALAAATQALCDAGWIGEGARPLSSLCATVLGTGYGSMSNVEEAYRVYFTEGWRKNPFLTVPMCMPNAAGSQVALDFDLRGPSWTLSAACASGASAIGEALRLIRSGAVRRAVAGGFDAIVTRGIFSIWCLLGVMSSRNHDPAGASAPFSGDRDGLVLERRPG
jgi:3-oxoacyl-[acyl-carrier-protein] synthase II